jgi:general stress protein YciG
MWETDSEREGFNVPKSKDSYAAEFARKGGKARAKKLTPEQRSEIARKAVQARWAKQKGMLSRDTET